MNANENIATATAITDLDAFRHLATKADWVDWDVDTDDDHGWMTITIWNRKRTHKLVALFNENDGSYTTAGMYWVNGDNTVALANYIKWPAIVTWLYDYAA